MHMRTVSLGEMWRSEVNGDLYIVTSFCREVLSSYAHYEASSHGNLRASKTEVAQD